MGKILGGGVTRTSHPNWPKGYSVLHGVCSAIKTRRSWEARQRAFAVMRIDLQNNCYVHWSPASREVAGHHLLLGSREQTIWVFFLLPHTDFVFTLLICLYLEP